MVRLGQRFPVWLLLGTIWFAVMGAPDPAASAQQDEIQVYADDINKRGEFGLEWHLNTTPRGRTTRTIRRDH